MSRLPLLLASAGLLTACYPTATLPGEGTSANAGEAGAGSGAGLDTAVERLGDTGEGGGGGDAVSESAYIYDPEKLHDFYIELDHEALQALTHDPYTYTEAGFTFEGESYGVVGVRLKGSGTYEPINQKPSFKVKFGFDGSETRLHGIRRITLHNGKYDPSLLKEHLVLTAFEELGLPASRSGFARVYVNDEYYGVYVLVETKDELFADAHYEDGSGALWEASSCDFDDAVSCWELDEPDDTLTEPETVGQFRSLCTEITSGHHEEWYETLQAHFTADHFHRYIAAEAVYAQWDGYADNIHNYHVYHEPSSGEWTFSPWGLDVALGPIAYGGNNCCLTYTPKLNQYDNGLLVQRCLQYEPCREELFATIEELTDAFEAQDLPAQLDERYAMLEEPLAEPSHASFTPRDVEEFVSCLRDWLEQQPEALRQQLEEWRRQYN